MRHYAHSLLFCDISTTCGVEWTSLPRLHTRHSLRSTFLDIVLSPRHLLVQSPGRKASGCSLSTVSLPDYRAVWLPALGLSCCQAVMSGCQHQLTRGPSAILAAGDCRGRPADRSVPGDPWAAVCLTGTVNTAGHGPVGAGGRRAGPVRGTRRALSGSVQSLGIHRPTR